MPDVHDLTLADIERMAQAELERRRKIGDATRERWACHKKRDGALAWRRRLAAAHARRRGEAVPS